MNDKTLRNVTKHSYTKLLKYHFRYLWKTMPVTAWRGVAAPNRLSWRSDARAQGDTQELAVARMGKSATTLHRAAQHQNYLKVLQLLFLGILQSNEAKFKNNEALHKRDTSYLNE